MARKIWFTYMTNEYSVKLEERDMESLDVEDFLERAIAKVVQTDKLISNFTLINATGPLSNKTLLSQVDCESISLIANNMTVDSADSVVLLWTALCRTNFDLSQGSIDHPENKKWPLVGRAHIYIRDVYTEISKKILERVLFIIKARGDGNSTLNCNALIIGTSGTGKSCFVFYLFVFLLKLDRVAHGLPDVLRFRYKRFDGSDYYLDSNGMAKTYNGEIVDFFFSDDSDIFRPDSSNLLTLLVSSERSANRKNFGKIVPSESLNLSMCMPVWSFDELKHIAPDHFTESDIKFRYLVFGGSARNFLSFSSFDGEADGSYPFIVDILQWFCKPEIDALQNNDSFRCIVEHIKTELSRHSQGQLEGTNMFTSLMWHTSNGREFFWASRVMELIGAHILRQKDHSLCAYLTQVIGNPGRGCCFEYIGHRSLLNLNDSIEMRRLKHKSSNIVLELSKVTIMQKFDSIEAIGSLQDRTYGIPIVCNFPVIDAVIQPDTLLQYTVGSDHKARRSCTEKLELIRNQLHDKNKNNHRLVFIVPAELCKNFKYQAGHGDIKQFVCTYETVLRAVKQRDEETELLSQRLSNQHIDKECTVSTKSR